MMTGVDGDRDGAGDRDEAFALADQCKAVIDEAVGWLGSFSVDSVSSCFQLVFIRIIVFRSEAHSKLNLTDLS